MRQPQPPAGRVSLTVLLYPSDGVLAAVLFNQPTKVFRILLLNYRSCYTKDELYQFTFAIFLLAASLFIKELIVLPFFYPPANRKDLDFFFWPRSIFLHNVFCQRIGNKG